MTNKFTMTQLLLGANVLMFLAREMSGEALAGFWSAMPLFDPANSNFRPWQFVTSMFTHGSLGHLVFNMFGLFSFGAVLERVWGGRRFLLFYFVVGIGAGLVYTAVNHLEANAARGRLTEMQIDAAALDRVGEYASPRDFALGVAQVSPQVLQEAALDDIIVLFRVHHVPVVGASGAIYGILTAFGMLFPWAKLQLIFLPVPIAAKYFIPGLLLLDLFSGVTNVSIFGGGIAHFAHLGGALIGFLLMLAWRKDLSLPPEVAARGMM